MTIEELMNDYFKELDDHCFQVSKVLPKNNKTPFKSLLIQEGEYQTPVLRIDFGYIDPVFVDRLGATDGDDLVEYSWLLMRTAIFLQDLERIGAL